jgi:hypothetical protein
MAVIETTVDQQNDLSVFTVNGELTADEIIQKVEEYYLKHPTKLVLWIMEDVQLANISTDNIERIIYTAKKHSGKRPEGKTAIVSTRDLDYGLSRMYEAHAVQENMPYEYKVFKDIDEAKEWLFTL